MQLANYKLLGSFSLVYVVAMATHVSIPRLLVCWKERAKVHDLLTFDLLAGTHCLPVPLFQSECKHLEFRHSAMLIWRDGGPYHTVRYIKATIRVKITNSRGGNHLEKNTVTIIMT